MPQKPYRVEPAYAGGSCKECGRPSAFNVIGPRRRVIHYHVIEEDDANELCDDLNNAYALGVKHGRESK